MPVRIMPTCSSLFAGGNGSVEGATVVIRRFLRLAITSTAPPNIRSNRFQTGGMELVYWLASSFSRRKSALEIDAATGTVQGQRQVSPEGDRAGHEIWNRSGAKLVLPGLRRFVLVD